MMIKNMPMGPFVDEFFNVAEKMNPLRLTDEEIGIFSAALIMCPGMTSFNTWCCFLSYYLPVWGLYGSVVKVRRL
jgi:hypothetical protein